MKNILCLMLFFCFSNLLFASNAHLEAARGNAQAVITTLQREFEGRYFYWADTFDELGNTPIDYAVFAGHVETVIDLINSDLSTSTLRFALISADRFGNHELRARLESEFISSRFQTDSAYREELLARAEQDEELDVAEQRQADLIAPIGANEQGQSTPEQIMTQIQRMSQAVVSAGSFNETNSLLLSNQTARSSRYPEVGNLISSLVEQGWSAFGFSSSVYR